MRASCLACVALACAPVAIPAPDLSGDGAIALHADVSPPYELVSAVVLVDGEVVARSPGRITLALAPGEHELAIAAKLKPPAISPPSSTSSPASAP